MSPEKLSEAWEEFKRRNGLTPERIRELTEEAATPKPPPDAQPPPKHHSDTDREPGSDG